MFARYSLLDFILLGNISSDYLEGRFGWYRQLCSANYYNSVTQFLQAEKTICLRSLVNMGFDMTQIKVMFETADINQSLEQVEEIKLFTSDLESFKFHNTTTTLLDLEQAIILYCWLHCQVTYKSEMYCVSYSCKSGKSRHAFNHRRAARYR